MVIKLRGTDHKSLLMIKLHVWVILFDVGNAFKQIPFYQTKDK